MARIRTIKPEFFTSEDIVSLSPLARLLYIAIWCESDKEGRLVWKPMTFKLRYFPADNCDIKALCQELTDSGMVVLYGDGCAYVPSFKAHQHVNPRESASQLPEPDASPRVGTRQSRVNSEIDPQVGREGKGREGNEEIQEPTVLVDKASPSRPPDCPTTEILNRYHERCPMLPRVEVVSDTRKRAMSARWREVVTDPDIRKAEDPKAAALEWFDWFFSHAAKSAFLTGKSKNWRADFDFLMTPTKFAKVVEGSYHKEHA